MKFLIAGLGNTGAEYELTRHNIGFLVLDMLAEKQKTDFELTRYAHKASFKYKGRHIYMIKPTTLMNLSGKAVNYWLKELKLKKKNLLVVTDDIALPFGKLRTRAKGSDAGHNGLRNIDLLTGDNDYARLRFGIGNEYHNGRQVEYVLSRFNEDEFKQLPQYIDKACEIILAFIAIGIDRTMNAYN
ncbi:MAG: aminoacyl-tRNA hydrolase [Bacteroidetes bacterium]|nr:aminoacyl-tRNA hydrolase [Bacteroidota bacterium]